MTETTSAGQAGAIAAEEAESAEVQESTEEGRYIPYGGGSMGWFENSGVLNCELGNNYLFFTAMASDKVRSKQFQRWGDKFNRRGPRRRVKRMTGVSFQSGRDLIRGSTRDISMQGVRLQFLTEITLQHGDDVQIKMHPSEQSTEVSLEATMRVVWIERIGRIRPVWNLGMTFEGLTAEQQDALKAFLTE